MAGELKLGPGMSMLEVGQRGWPRAMGIGGGAVGLSGMGGGRES
jgi:hypothetical protein